MILIETDGDLLDATEFFRPGAEPDDLDVVVRIESRPLPAPKEPAMPEPTPFRYRVEIAVPGGRGTAEVRLACPIRTRADVAAVERILRDAGGPPSLSVIGFMPVD